MSAKFTVRSKRLQAMLIRTGKALGKDADQITTAIGLYWIREIDRTFQTEGARAGLPGWPRRSRATEETRVGTSRLAYGTDMSPTLNRAQFADARSEAMSIGLWRWGQRGFFPGYEGKRRYDRSPRLLQVSGSFRQTFRILARSNRGVLVGTRPFMRTPSGIVRASDIMRGRPVISITDRDRHAMVKTVLTAIRSAVKK